MKLFWKKHRHTLKFTLPSVLISAIAFLFLSRFVTKMFHDLYPNSTDYMNWMLFFTFWADNLFLVLFVSISAAIPGLIGGFIINHYSQRELDCGQEDIKRPMLRGALIGFLGAFLISFIFILDPLLDIFHRDYVDFYPITLWISALILGALAGAGAGFLIHAENVKNYEPGEQDI